MMEDDSQVYDSILHDLIAASQILKVELDQPPGSLTILASLST